MPRRRIKRNIYPSRWTHREPCNDAALVRLPVSFYASLRHYADHLIPVYLSLPPDRQGSFYVAEELLEHCERNGVKALSQHWPDDNTRQQKSKAPWGCSVPWDYGCPVVVAGYGDLRRVRHCYYRPVIGMEHGCGLTYTGDLPDSWGNVHAVRMQFKTLTNGLSLRFVPNEQLAALERRAFSVPVHMVGDSPKMDRWRTRSTKQNSEPVVAFSSHFNLDRVPETRSVFPFYQEMLPELAKHYKVIGHYHPKEWERVSPIYEDIGIECVADFDEVMERADVYLSNSSSTLYEFASLNKPVVVLRAPFMRRHVNHGLLFWDYVPGVECWSSDELLQKVDDALRDTEEIQEQRMKAVDYVYPNRDGASAQRVVERVLSWQNEYSKGSTPTHS